MRDTFFHFAPPSGPVCSTWNAGLQREGKNKGSYEFKLCGTPWWADGQDTVESRYLVGTLLAELKKEGWEVGATLDVSRKLQDKTVFVMKQCPPSKQEWAVIGFHETNKVSIPIIYYGKTMGIF